MKLEGAVQAHRAEIEERIATEERTRRLLRQIVNAQQDERRRIARDLHDQLGQRLTALRSNLEIIGGQPADNLELSAQVEQAQIAAKQLDAEVDFLSWEMRPAALDDLVEGDKIDESALQYLIRAAVAYNVASGTKK